MNLSPCWLTILCCSFAALPGFSQVYIGISGGGGLPDQVVFRGGAPVDIEIKANFSLRVEAIFAQRENIGVLSKLSSGRNYILPVINYLELPVLAKFRLPFELFDFYGLVGPHVGYGLKLSSTYLEDNIYYQETLSFSETGVARFDCGVMFGAGIEKEISQGRKIFIDLRYYLGLKNINLDPGEQIFNEGRSFALGFLIPIRRRGQ